MDRDPERATKRIKQYFAQIEAEGLPIEEAVQEICEAIGCSRESIYHWKGGSHRVSRAYARDLELALNDLEKKHGFS